MNDSKFTWIDFYMEFADRLLAYRSDRPALIEKLMTAYATIGMRFPRLDSRERPYDIDPYTVFGLFNKGITESNRKKIIGALAEEFEISAALPKDFAGTPVLNNMNATFYAFVGDPRREEDDIEDLWGVFEAQLSLSERDDEERRAAFIEAFDAADGQFGLGWKLTMGLYWARPLRFINMDSRNRWYLGDRAAMGQRIADVFPKEKSPLIANGSTYLAICDIVASRLGSDECPKASFPEISDAAFAESERVNREKKTKAKTPDTKVEENSLGDADVETVHYWLYAPGEGAGMWSEFYDKGVMGLGWSDLGDLSVYPSKEDMRRRLVELSGGSTSQKNAAHAVWQFTHDLKPNDVVFAKQGRSKILGRGVVLGDYEYDAAAGKYPNVRNVDWECKGEWSCDEMFAMKTLTDVTDYTDFVAKIEAFFQDERNDADNDELVVEHPAYDKDDFLAEVFMPESRYDSLCGILRAKKNVILQGAPGVGKTFAAKRLAYSMMGVKDPERVMMVQFHQSYSYEDFIEGYRPSSEGFELVKGSFYSFCKRAAEDIENDYFFIIDEINRGNLSKIFGELFMLIESDKRGSKNKLQLLYSHELFYVPSNVFLIGMMNTADRSLAMLDFALRRRFAFFDLKPGFDTDGFIEYRKSLASPKFDELVACVIRLNDDIAADETLGEGFALGHSYFCGLDGGAGIDAKLSSIVEYELIPMLREYWFDDQAKVREWSDVLRRIVG